MSYCRWGWDGSDVYIYGTEIIIGGEHAIVCCGCDDGTCFTYGEIFQHISNHRAAGEHVPAYVDEQLHEEINDPEKRWVPVGVLPENMHPDPGVRRPEPPAITAMRDAVEKIRQEQQ